MPLSNPAFILLFVLAAAGVAVAGGLVHVLVADGVLMIRIRQRQQPAMTFEFRDTWLLLALAVGLGWTIAAALDHTGWVDGTARLSPALLLATLVGWVLAVGVRSRPWFMVLAGLTTVGELAIFQPIPQARRPALLPADQFVRWTGGIVTDPHFALLLGLLLLVVITGLWTAWWTFRRRNGLVALLPTGTVMAVEILNDTNPVLYFFTLCWLACAALLLVRLNFVGLKQRWRARRVLRAADTGWNFGEVGFEATALLLVVAFLLPPLSSEDISGFLVPGTVNTTQFHPFGFGTSRVPVSGQVGYSSTIRPGTRLKAKPVTVMVVSGDVPPFYPYFRGIALGAWDGLQWTPLPSTPDVPVRKDVTLPANQTLSRDDLPPTNHLEYAQTTFRMVVYSDETENTVFSAGEAIRVSLSATVRGIVTTLPAQGSVLPLPPGPFDTVDLVRLAKRARPSYTYVVYEAIPKIDVTSLQQSSTDYPAWVEPFRQLYYQGRMVSGYTNRDSDIAALALKIVRDAGATTPYDEAKAIESWFLDPGRFTYTLDTPQAASGVRPLDYFLFSTRKGYCQDFSTAMAVMLRSLGIPVRQMSGFGRGTLDDRTHQIFVSSTDAHSWVEVYFTGYGWIPFEPTPDGVNQPINRPKTAADLLVPILTPSQSQAAPRRTGPARAELPPDQGGGISDTLLSDVLGNVRWVGIGLLVLLLLVTAFVLRWLMAVRDVPRIWRRLLFLGDRLHVSRRPSDTPNEYGARLARAVPPLEGEIRTIARLYTRHRFRRSGLNAPDVTQARRSWYRVRKEYAGLVIRSLRNGSSRAVSEEASSASGSRGRARRR